MHFANLISQPGMSGGNYNTVMCNLRPGGRCAQFEFPSIQAALAAAAQLSAWSEIAQVGSCICLQIMPGTRHGLTSRLRCTRSCSGVGAVRRDAVGRPRGHLLRAHQ